MIDFPLDGLLDEPACLNWLEHSLHPDGLRCPRCNKTERRRARQEGAIPSFRCKGCDRYYTVLTGTLFAKTRQPPSTLVLMLRGIANTASQIRTSLPVAFDALNKNGAKRAVERRAMFLLLTII